MIACATCGHKEPSARKLAQHRAQAHGDRRLLDRLSGQAKQAPARPAGEGRRSS